MQIPSSAPEGALKLAELATAAGMPPRTIRYYIQRGLLPAPAFQGRDTLYPGDTLLRLTLIRRLQERFMPLELIRATLTGKTQAELEALLYEEDKALSIGMKAPSSLAEERAIPQQSALAAARSLPGPSLEAPPASAPAAASSPPAAVQSSPLPPAMPLRSGLDALPGVPWRRLELLPGLELFIEEGSSERLQLARELLSYVRARTQSGLP